MKCVQNGLQPTFLYPGNAERYERIVIVEILSPHLRLSSQSPSAAQLEAMFLAAHQKWWVFFYKGDCWTDAEQRRAMLLARLEYQEAKLNWLFFG